jgi:phosphate transport system permease protein
MIIVIPVTLILGVSTAIYIEEYAKDGILQRLIRVNISNLASVPSVIFGLLGLTFFSRVLGLGQAFLLGGLRCLCWFSQLSLWLPRRQLRSVPLFLREASYGMGADKWTTIWRVILPVALPGILTGAILAISRAIGETAPLVVLGYRP